MGKTVAFRNTKIARTSCKQIRRQYQYQHQPKHSHLPQIVAQQASSVEVLRVGLLLKDLVPHLKRITRLNHRLPRSQLSKAKVSP